MGAWRDGLCFPGVDNAARIVGSLEINEVLQVGGIKKRPGRLMSSKLR